MAKIEINGVELEAREGAMVIEMADEAGITIPRFCYHKKLSIAASCRMCLVEVEKVGKPVPACATPVSDGMRVFTRSPKALAAQNAVMEFLLINHPLDCPVCDQGGECDLQEMAIGFGNDESQFAEPKRVVPSKNIGPLIATDMTRCIHCTRCVRFGQEIAGSMELGAPGRGENTRITTWMEGTVDSELSGNVIDLCPVGALTSKPFRHTARPWELSGHDAVSPHDCVGTNLRLHVRSGQVVRAVARENEAVNESWIADRDRFSYLGSAHEERLTRPMVKKNGRWEESDWDGALIFAADRLKQIRDRDGGGAIGALAGYSASVEEFYLLQKLLRGIGSDNIDHRLRQQDFSDQAHRGPFPWLGRELVEMSVLDAALLVGSNVRKEQPLLGHRLRQAVLGGAKVSAINPMAYPFHFDLMESRTGPDLVSELAAVAKVLVEEGATAPEGLAALLTDVTVAEAHRRMAKQLHGAERASLLLGGAALAHPAAATLCALGQAVAKMSGARFGVIAEGGNAAGAWLAGVLPHRLAGGRPVEQAGRSWRDMMDGGIQGLLLLNTEPELEALDSALAQRGLETAECVVALTPWVTESMRSYADVLLPTALFPESSGSYVNADGRWQQMAGCAHPPGESRPAWKVLRVLGNLFDVSGFDYMASDEVLAEVREACAAVEPGHGDSPLPKALHALEGALVRLADTPIYSVDGMVRRAGALQQTADARVSALYLNTSMAAAHGVEAGKMARVRQGEAEVILPVVPDEQVPDGCVYLPAGCVTGAGAAYAPVEVAPA